MLFKKIFLITISISLLIFCWSGCSKKQDLTVDELNKKALELYKQQQTDKAIEITNEALAKAEDKYGKNHISVIHCLENLALFYHSKDNIAEAERLYQQALNRLDRLIVENNLEGLKIKNNFAAVLFSLGKCKEAGALYKQILATMEKSLPANDPRLETLRSDIKACNDRKIAETSEQNQSKSKSSDTQGSSSKNDGILDLVPQNVKDYTIKGYAQKDIIIKELSPMNPVQIGDDGIVFPYRCKKGKKGFVALDAVLLFAAKKKPEEKDKVIFYQSRMVSYQSYMGALKKGGVSQLKDELSDIFPDLYL